MSISDSQEVGDNAVAGTALDVGVHHVAGDPVRSALGRVVFPEIVLKRKSKCFYSHFERSWACLLASLSKDFIAFLSF